MLKSAWHSTTGRRLPAGAGQALAGGLLAFALASAGACGGPEVPATAVVCAATSDCATGQSCVGGQCNGGAAPGPDGGKPDAGPADAGGAHDGGSVDAGDGGHGGPDAGTGGNDAGTGGNDAGTNGTDAGTGGPDAGPATGVVNGDFETGTLTGWTTTGAASVVSSGAHGGQYAAQVGSSSPSADSSIRQQLVLPAAAQLSFWYSVTCGDSAAYDWASVTIRSSGGAILAEPLANTCSQPATWVQVSVDLTRLAGETVVLSFNNHDDGVASDPTWTLFDDVQVTGR